jgi:Tfp pilus assembly protein PilF
LAQQAFQAEDFQEAVRLLETIVHLGRTGTYDPSAAFDPSIMAEPAVVNLGFGYLRLGDLDRADACFGQVVGHPTHQAKARQGLALVADLRRRRPKV